jgi:hypothetical protein
VLWCLLLAICWPLAFLVLLLWPAIWLLSLPVRILGAVLEGVVGLFVALLLLPARLLGYRS